MTVFRFAKSSIAAACISICFSAVANPQVTPSQDSAPRFEVASFRIDEGPLVKGVSMVPKGGPGTTDPGRFTYPQQSLKVLIMYAYGLPASRISGPSWLDDYAERFTLIATMSKATTKDQFLQMMQNLMKERFHLTFHHETKVFPGFDLVVNRGGPKSLKSWTPVANAEWKNAGPDQNGFPQLPPTQVGAIATAPSPIDRVIRSTHRQTMGDFAKRLGSLIGSLQTTGSGSFAPQVVDKTSALTRSDPPALSKNDPGGLNRPSLYGPGDSVMKTMNHHDARGPEETMQDLPPVVPAERTSGSAPAGLR